MPALEVPGSVIYFETAGPEGAPALLLIHAGIATLRMWDPIMAALTMTHRVVRYDTRGFGNTVSTDDRFSNRADAIAVLDAAGVDRATIVGGSRGGAIAIDTALEYPERIDGIVTIGSSASGFDPVDLTPMEESMFADIDALWDAKDWKAMADAEVRLWSIGPTRNDSDLDPAFVTLAYALNRANVPRVEEDVDPIPLEPQAASRLDTIQVPVLVTVGDSDVSEAIAYADQLVEGLRYATKAVLTDSAHLPSVEHPEQFVSVLLPWLDKNGL